MMSWILNTSRRVAGLAVALSVLGTAACGDFLEVEDPGRFTDDALNTPLALSKLHELSSKLNKTELVEEKSALQAQLLASAKLLGLLQQDPQQWFTETSNANEISAAEVEELIAQRQQAKKDKQYARADEIRAHLSQRGVLLEDSRQGTSWRRT